MIETLLVKLEFITDKICLQGKITNIERNGESLTVRLIFESVNLLQKRQLIELLFCRSGRWQRQEIPGELQSLWLLLRILLRPRFLFERKSKIKGMRVSQI